MKKREVVFISVIILFISLLSASTFEDKSQSNFDNGSYSKTFYNFSIGAIQLNNSQGFLSGNFTSRIFDAGSVASWNLIFWIRGGKYRYELPNNNQIEDSFGGADMNGNVLLFHLNESGGTIFDYSGKGNNGTITGVITYNAAGKFGKGVDAGGSTGRIAIPTTGIPSMAFNDSITIESWIKWDGESGENFNLQNVVTAGSYRKALRITEPDHWNGGSQLLSYFTIGGIDIDLYSSTKISTINWTHITTTYNGTALSIYINGKLETFNSTISGQIVSNDDSVYIGAESGSVSNFDGIIDEVAIYNRSLSAEEILKRYERGVLQLNLSVRSCDDADCVGESFTILNDTSPQSLNLSNNTYFQYFVSFSSENESTSPQFFNLTIDYTISNVAPSVTILSPPNGTFFNFNTSIPLNFTASDSDNNLHSCWYTLNSGANNFTISSCNNFTFNSSAGLKTIYVYANDTSGEISNDSISFTIDITYPEINILYPQNTNYSLNVDSLNYSVSDSYLQSCWYSLDSGETNITTNCGSNITGLSSNQGINIWKVYSNDSAGNINSSSVTFFIDSIIPLISYGTGTEENGTTFSRSYIYVNISVTEINEANVTFNLYNSTSLINSTTFISSQRTINWTNLANGIYKYNVTIYDIVGNKNSTETRFITLDTIPPNLSLVSPSQGNYSNATLLVNISSDSSSIWFFNGSENITYSSSAYYVFSQGFTILIAYSNDSAGNINSTNISFNIDSLAPSLVITKPIDGSTFGTNLSLSLNFSVFDNNLQSCWYNLDNGINATLQNCQNTIFNISSGFHVVYLFANDSFGNLATNNSSFNIQIGAPSISLISPVGDYLNITQNIELIYTASDSDLDSCELWGDFNGTFELNQINSNVVSGIDNYFFLNITDGIYLWNIKCNDSFGNNAFAENETFYIDTINPLLTLSQPTGSYSSRNNIPIVFNASDASPLICYYKVYRGINLEIQTTSVSCLSGSSDFDVTLDADFVLSFFAEDPLGHINYTSSSFTVSTSTGGGSSGGGGGGGSTTIIKPGNATTIIDLSVEKISDIVADAGDIKKVTWGVENIGTAFLNDCKFLAGGLQKSWIDNGGQKDLSAGEQYDFVFDINIPDDAESGSYNIILSLVCKEVTKTTSFKIDILNKELGLKLVKVERSDKDKVRVVYSVEELSGLDQNLEFQFIIFDSNNERVAEISESKTISANGKEEYETLIPIDALLSGELSLLVNLNSDTYSTFVQENIVLGKFKTTGLTIFDNFGGTNTIISMVIGVLFLAFAVVMVIRILKLRKKVMPRRREGFVKKFFKTS